VSGEHKKFYSIVLLDSNVSKKRSVSINGEVVLDAVM